MLLVAGYMAWVAALKAIHLSSTKSSPPVYSGSARVLFTLAVPFAYVIDVFMAVVTPLWSQLHSFVEHQQRPIERGDQNQKFVDAFFSGLRRFLDVLAFPFKGAYALATFASVAIQGKIESLVRWVRKIVPVEVTLQGVVLLLVLAGPPYSQCSYGPKLVLLSVIARDFSTEENELELDKALDVIRSVGGLLGVFQACSAALSVATIAWAASPLHASNGKHRSFHVIMYAVMVAIQVSVTRETFMQPSNTTCGFGARACETSALGCCCTESTNLITEPVIVNRTANTIMVCAACKTALQQDPPTDCCGTPFNSDIAFLMAGPAGCLCAGNGKVTAGVQPSCRCYKGFSGSLCDMADTLASGWTPEEQQFAVCLTSPPNTTGCPTQD